MRQFDQKLAFLLFTCCVMVSFFKFDRTATPVNFDAARAMTTELELNKEENLVGPIEVVFVGPVIK